MNENKIENLKIEIKNNPENIEKHMDLAWAYEKKGLLREAITELKTALEKGYNPLPVYINIGRLLWDLNQYEEAIKELKVAISKNVDSEFIRKELARSYLGMRDYSSSEAELRKALKYSSDNPEIHLELGRVFNETGNYESAIASYQEAIKYDKENPQYHIGLSRIYDKKNNSHESLKHLEIAFEKGIKTDELLINMGSRYRDTGKTEESIEKFNEALFASSDRNLESFKNRIKNEIEISEKKIVLKSLPRSLAVSLTNRCNLQCIMCDVWKTPGDLSDKLIKEIEEMIPYLNYITWLGGEAFLSKDFKRLFTKAAEFSGLKQNIVTNGMLITDEWARILSSTNTCLVFSIDAVTKKTYEQIRKGADFGNLIKSLELINSYKNKQSTSRNDLTLIMQMVGLKENVDEYDKIIDFMKKYGFNRLQIVPLAESINNSENIYLSEDMSKKLRKNIRNLIDEASTNNIKVINGLPIDPYLCDNDHAEQSKKTNKEKNSRNYDGALKKSDISNMLCLLPWQHLTVSVDGIVSIYCFCPSLNLGDASKLTIKEIWNGEPIRNIRKKIIDNKAGEVCNMSCAEGLIARDTLRVDT